MPFPDTDDNLDDLRTEARLERQAMRHQCGACKHRGGHAQGCPEADDAPLVMRPAPVKSNWVASIANANAWMASMKRQGGVA